jgi:predicted transcriptional regulator
MPASTTLTVRLTPEVKNHLAQLSRATRRTRSFLAAEAIAAYVARELQIVQGVERGLADLNAGRVIAHDQAMNELDAVIEQTARRRK